MVRSLTKLLLLVHGLSIVSPGLSDMGHEVLHQVNNNIHYHEHTDHHHIHDHNTLLKTDPQHNRPDSELRFPINSYFVFFEDGPTFSLELNSNITHTAAEPITKLHCGYIAPATRPPLLFA